MSAINELFELTTIEIFHELNHEKNSCDIKQNNMYNLRGLFRKFVLYCYSAIKRSYIGAVFGV